MTKRKLKHCPARTPGPHCAGNSCARNGTDTPETISVHAVTDGKTVGGISMIKQLLSLICSLIISATHAETWTNAAPPVGLAILSFSYTRSEFGEVIQLTVSARAGLSYVPQSRF